MSVVNVVEVVQEPDWFARGLASVSLLLSVVLGASSYRQGLWRRRAAFSVLIEEPFQAVFRVVTAAEQEPSNVSTLWSPRHIDSMAQIREMREECPDTKLSRWLTALELQVAIAKGDRPGVEVIAGDPPMSLKQRDAVREALQLSRHIESRMKTSRRKGGRQ